VLQRKLSDPFSLQWGIGGMLSLKIPGSGWGGWDEHVAFACAVSEVGTGVTVSGGKEQK
jgi:hypothetical protein